MGSGPSAAATNPCMLCHQSSFTSLVGLSKSKMGQWKNPALPSPALPPNNENRKSALKLWEQVQLAVLSLLALHLQVWRSKS